MLGFNSMPMSSLLFPNNSGRMSTFPKLCTFAFALVQRDNEIRRPRSKSVESFLKGNEFGFINHLLFSLSYLLDKFSNHYLFNLIFILLFTLIINFHYVFS